MSDPTPFHPQPQPHDEFTSSSPGLKPAPQRESNLKYYIVSTLVTLLVLFLLFQQMQISQLQNDIAFLRNEWKKDNETKTQTLVNRMDAVESKIELLDSKIAYLQTGLAAAAQRAEAAAVKTEEAAQAEEARKAEEKKICVGPFCLQ